MTGLADVYINSGGSTYKWDTCAPHSILTSLGGGIIECQPLLTGADETDDIRYNVQGDQTSNSRGIIAFRNLSNLDLVANIFRNIKM